MLNSKLYQGLCAFSLLLCEPLLAQTGATAAEPGVPALYVLKMLVGLLFVIAIIGGLAHIYKKMGVHQFRAQRFLAVEQALSLGNKEKIVLVNVGGRRLLLGVTAIHVEKLMELESLDQLDQSEQPNQFNLAGESSDANKQAGTVSLQGSAS